MVQNKLPRTAAERLPLAQRYLTEKMILSSPPREVDAQRFREYFGVELRDYWEGLLKLNVVKFDEEFIKSHKNESAAEAIVRKFGKPACAFVLTLL